MFYISNSFIIIFFFKTVENIKISMKKRYFYFNTIFWNFKLYYYNIN